MPLWNEGLVVYDSILPSPEARPSSRRTGCYCTPMKLWKVWRASSKDAKSVFSVESSHSCPDRFSTRLTSRRLVVGESGNWPVSVRTLRPNDLHFLPVVRKLLPAIQADE